MPAALSQRSHMRCRVAQVCQGMIWYELETWWDRDYRPTRPDALILTHETYPDMFLMMNRGGWYSMAHVPVCCTTRTT